MKRKIEKILTQIFLVFILILVPNLTLAQTFHGQLKIDGTYIYTLDNYVTGYDDHKGYDFGYTPYYNDYNISNVNVKSLALTKVCLCVIL